MLELLPQRFRYKYYHSINKATLCELTNFESKWGK